MKSFNGGLLAGILISLVAIIFIAVTFTPGFDVTWTNDVVKAQPTPTQTTITSHQSTP